MNKMRTGLLTAVALFAFFIVKAGERKLLTSEIGVSHIVHEGFELNWTTSVPTSFHITITQLEDNKQWDIQDLNYTDKHTYVFSSGLPGKIYKADFVFTDNEGNSEKHQACYATQSSSTGKITVYFNHQVNTNVATTQNAIYLNKAVDDTLINYINRADSTIDIAIYNSDGPSTSSSNPLSDIAQALNNAYSRGVKIRIVYNQDTQNDMLSLLNSNIPKQISPVPDFTYGLMHNKFVVIDANATDQNTSYVWTGSCNWTRTQINSDKNNVIIIQDQSLAQAYKLEFEEMWGSTGITPNSTVAKFGPFKTDNTPHYFNIGGRNVESYFSPSDGTTQKIINVLNSANSDIEIATMSPTRDDIRDAIVNKYNGGLHAIHVLEDDGSYTGDDFTTYQSTLPSGQAVLWSPQSYTMHHKFCIVDEHLTASDPIVLTGSHNWSSSAQSKNDENTLVVHDSTIANLYYQAFTYLFNSSGGQFYNTVTGLNSSNANPGVYPNPAKGIFYLNLGDLKAEAVSIEIYDVQGRLMDHISKSGLKEINAIHTSNWSNGIYVIKVITGKGIHSSRIQVLN